MFLVVGLGNPGEKYIHTRHNVGFDVLEIISQTIHVPIKKIKFKSCIAEFKYKNERVILCKPQTFMNLSGDAVQEIMNFYKIPPENVIIVYDDIDLDFADIRFREKGSAGTHNGMRDIIKKTGFNTFARLRIGIGRPVNGYNLIDWVLSKYHSKEEKDLIFKSFTIAANASLIYTEGNSDEVRKYLQNNK